VSNGPNGVRDTTDPDAGAFSLAGDDVLLGPVAADWALRPEPSAGPPADRGRGRGPQRPDVELVGGADGVTSVVVRAGRRGGGALQPGLVAHATERRLGRDQARVLVPGLTGMEIVDPVPIITSSHLVEVEVDAPAGAEGERPARTGRVQNTVGITPGRLRPDSQLRNLLRVRVFANPDDDALVGTRVFFRSVDVDDQAVPPVDPTDVPGEPDNRSDSFEDVVTGDPVDVPPEGRLSAQSALIRRDDEGRLVATVDLTVSFSPGDNYRVVATTFEDFQDAAGPLDPRGLADDWAGRDETDAEGDEVEGGRVVVTFGGAPVLPTIVTGESSDTPFPIRASDVITVWRVVHVETDAMEEVDDDQRRAQGLLKQGVVLSVNADVMVVGELDPPLVQTPDSRPVPEQLGMLQGGRVERLAGEIITEVDATIVRAEAVRLPGNRPA